MNNVEILPLSQKYIEEIITINNLSFYTPWTRESMEKELENQFAKYVVAVKDDVAIGYGGVWLIVDEGHITNIAVHPEFRGIGAGDMILDALIKVCREEKAFSMTLEVRASNIVAQNLYKKHGFVEEGIRKGYYADTREDGIIMWKHDIK